MSHLRPVWSVSHSYCALQSIWPQEDPFLSLRESVTRIFSHTYLIYDFCFSLVSGFLCRPRWADLIFSSFTTWSIWPFKNLQSIIAHKLLPPSTTHPHLTGSAEPPVDSQPFQFTLYTHQGWWVGGRVSRTPRWQVPCRPRVRHTTSYLRDGPVTPPYTCFVSFRSLPLTGPLRRSSPSRDVALLVVPVWNVRTGVFPFHPTAHV